MTTMTLRPGLLVQLSTKIEGGVQYTRLDLDPDRKIAEGSTIAKWETTKIVDDVAAYDRAVKIRGKMSSLIRGVCSHSAFGLLCTATNEKALDEAIVEARTLGDRFNEERLGIGVYVYCLKGRIAGTDEEAVRAIGSELRGLIGEMQSGVISGNVDAIRKAAAKAQSVGKMLDEETGKKVTAAIKEARAAATTLTKGLTGGVDKALETVKLVSQMKLDALENARFAFLDLDEPKAAIEGEKLPSVEARNLDLDEDTGEGESDEDVPDDVDATRAVDEDIEREAEAMAVVAGDVRELDFK